MRAVGLGQGLNRGLLDLQCPQAHPPNASTARGQQGKEPPAAVGAKGQDAGAEQRREQLSGWGCDHGCWTRTEREARSGGQDRAGVGARRKSGGGWARMPDRADGVAGEGDGRRE